MTVLAYIAAMSEDVIQLRKSKPMVLGSAVVWFAICIYYAILEFNLLSVLVRHAGFVVTHRQLLEKVWGASRIEHSHYLRIYMGTTTTSWKPIRASPRYLLTEAGIGYRLYEGEN